MEDAEAAHASFGVFCLARPLERVGGHCCYVCPSVIYCRASIEHAESELLDG
jgi:phosphate uptake regulator